jgi:hypothetical protein
MDQKSVSEMIFDRFEESIKNDIDFNEISEKLFSFIRSDNHRKTELQDILKEK